MKDLGSYLKQQKMILQYNVEIKQHTMQLSVQIEEKNWKRTSKNNPTPADLGFGNIPYGPGVVTEQKEKQEDRDKSPVSRPNLPENTRNFMDEILHEEIMHEDPHIDHEPPKEQREGGARPNKRKSTSWKKSSLQSKMERMASNFIFNKTSTSSSEAGDSPELRGSDSTQPGPAKI